MSVTIHIRDLVQAKLVGRTIDVVGFVDEILALAAESGAIRCCLASESALRFELGDEVCEVELDSCRGKLRMLCARLAVLCNETEGAAVSPYGGKGAIRTPSHNGSGLRQCAVRFENTPADHGFSIDTGIVPGVRGS